MSSKALALTIVAVGGAVAVGYIMGTKQAAAPSAPAPAASAPPAQAKAAGGAVDLLPADQAKAHKTRFTHFRVGNRNVKGMLADGEVVWVGTSGGVIRYNLKTNKYDLFDVNNGSLISNGVFHVSKVRGKIVVGTYGGGMSVFDPGSGKWTNYNIPQGLADQFVYDIAETPEGDYWIATWSGANRVKGGRLDDPKAWETYTVESTQGGLPNDWVYGVEVGRNGDVWFATEGGLARYNGGRWTNWNHDKGLGAPYEKVKDDIAFTRDPAKASKHHAHQKSEQGLENVKVGYNPNYIVSLVVDGDGKVWCGTWGGGLSLFDPETETFTTYTTKEGLPGNHVFMLKMGKDGRLWIGTNKGLARFRPDGQGFQVMTKRDGLYADNVFSMAEAQDGSLWVGSFGGVARIFGAI